MITYSGVHIQKIGGAEGIPTPEDIAVAAGRTCRFVGAVWYPNLAHFIFVGLLAWKRSGSLATFIWGILHDAHETATGDTPRPFKCDCMRAEQRAIDARLLKHYLPCAFCSTEGSPVHIGRGPCKRNVDFSLIKACDDDACDIEAVELSLPNFAEIEIAHTKDYRGRTAIYTDAVDVALFHRVKSAFGGFETVQGEASSAVRGLIALLQRAEQHDLKGVQAWIDSWGQLDAPAHVCKEAA
ncbi:MAG TPA: hypothetical protein VGO43_08250 [Pyrinomonadaceae bacterium]|jgi:hypothetical protein|nr:hypothetical protein [Pyrinomonadaceae bacterium]